MPQPDDLRANVGDDETSPSPLLFPLLYPDEPEPEPEPKRDPEKTDVPKDEKAMG